MLFLLKAFHVVGTEIISKNVSFQTKTEGKYAAFISVPGRMNKQLGREAKERGIT